MGGVGWGGVDGPTLKRREISLAGGLRHLVCVAEWGPLAECQRTTAKQPRRSQISCRQRHILPHMTARSLCVLSVSQSVRPLSTSPLLLLWVPLCLSYC